MKTVCPSPVHHQALLSFASLLVVGCLVDLNEVREPNADSGVSATGGSPSGGMGGESGSGGGPEASGGAPTDSGGTGGKPEYGPNLITNGDFSDGTTGWDNGGLAPVPPPLSDGMGCTSDGGHMMPPDQFIGWSGGTGGATLEAGTYRYEFRMVASGDPVVEVKIASTIPPDYEPWLLKYQIVPSDSDDIYVYEFVVVSQEPQMGLLFNARDGQGQVCVDDVSLRKVLSP